MEALNVGMLSVGTLSAVRSVNLLSTDSAGGTYKIQLGSQLRQLSLSLKALDR